MIDLLNIEEENIGGLEGAIQFAPKKHFQSTDPTALTFKPGYDWVNVKITSESGSINHESVPDDAGDYYNVTISGSLPKERKEVDQGLSKHLGLPLIVKLKDQNGNLRVCGCALGELYLFDNSGSGANASDENGYKISFKGKQKDKAVFL